MRIIDYYNIIATAIFAFICLASVILRIREKHSGDEGMGSGLTWGMFALIMVIAAVIRLYGLDKIPYGLQQDEASLGYDAYCLATYGIDRNGYHWPVYPITWGCGGGSPLLIYLNVLSISLFGTGIAKLRLIPAVLGTITVALFYFTLRLIYEGRRLRNEISLLGAAFFALCPWHVILSRWSLDCNIMPFNMMLAVWLYVLAAKKRSTIIYILSAISFAICMYSYGAATIVIPVFLVIISIYSYRHKILSIPQLLFAIVAFVIVFSPLLLFYCINYLGFKEIITPYISFNRFTSARTGEAFISFDSEMPAKMLANLKSLVNLASIGDYDLPHSFSGYSTLFKFSWPLIILGILLAIRDIATYSKNEAFFYKGKYPQFENITGAYDDVDQIEIYLLGHAIFLVLLLANIILLLLAVPDTSRMVMIFIPLIHFFIRGAKFVINRSKGLFAVVSVVVLVAALSFTKDYFTDYNNETVSIFMPGYGEAIKRAYDIAGDDREIYSTYEGLSAPFVLALYYNDYDPDKFYTTVEYKDEKAEFRIARAFGNFVFELPEDMTAAEYAEDVFVVASSQIDVFRSDENYITEQFGGYWVAYKNTEK